ncbi:MAG: endonuclease III domain-containing protein [Promethearchaeota archaeon]
MTPGLNSKISVCDDQPCRVKMLNEMYNCIQGTGLLLEIIQSNSLSEIHYGKYDPERKKYAFKTLIATILSARSKDETIIKVIEALWEMYSTPEAIANAPLEKIEELIYSSGTYHQKAIRIKETSKIIHQNYNDKVPDTLEELVKLPGVGRKVANCVLNISFDKAAIAVDTHVHRISNRIGWVKTKNPEKTEKMLENLFPRSHWKMINYTLVSFGKKICKPKNPLCNQCPVNDRCLKMIELPKKSKKSKKK